MSRLVASFLLGVLVALAGVAAGAAGLWSAADKPAVPADPAVVRVLDLHLDESGRAGQRYECRPARRR